MEKHNRMTLNLVIAIWDCRFVFIFLIIKNFSELKKLVTQIIIGLLSAGVSGLVLKVVRKII